MMMVKMFMLHDKEEYDADHSEEYDADDKDDNVEYEEYLSPPSPPSSLNLSLIDSRAPHLIFAMRVMMTKVLIKIMIDAKKL